MQAGEFWCKIKEISKKFNTCKNAARLSSQRLFPFSNVKVNEGCSSIRTCINTLVLAFSGHKTKT